MNKQQNDMKVTRINTGIYKITKGDKVYQAMKSECGLWDLFEEVPVTDYNPIGGLEWLQGYQDLKSCKICVQYSL
jgi:hypothetical protein